MPLYPHRSARCCATLKSLAYLTLVSVIPRPFISRLSKCYSYSSHANQPKLHHKINHRSTKDFVSLDLVTCVVRSLYEFLQHSSRGYNTTCRNTRNKYQTFLILHNVSFDDSASLIVLYFRPRCFVVRYLLVHGGVSH